MIKKQHRCKDRDSYGTGIQRRRSKHTMERMKNRTDKKEIDII